MFYKIIFYPLMVNKILSTVSLKGIIPSSGDAGSGQQIAF